MKKVTTIISMLFLGTVLMASQNNTECKTECEIVQIEDIVLVEIEEEIDLGFDTAKYLPIGFDAYEGMAWNMNDIVVEEEEIDLGFDTSLYLPDGFNAYKGMVFEIDEIVVIEEEEEIILDFDVQNYLPKNFNALTK